MMRSVSSQPCYAGDVAKTFVGSRVRQLRSERGFSQAALAQMLEISPSYLNQIEHDVRPLTVAVLLRITEVFGVDATFFASQDDTRLVAELREVTMDRDLGIDVDPSELADIVSAHPTLARAMVNLHQRYRLTTTQLAAATEDRFTPTAAAAARSRCRTKRSATTSTNGRTICTNSTPPPRTSPMRMRMHRADLARDLSDRLSAVHGVRIVKRHRPRRHRCCTATTPRPRRWRSAGTCRRVSTCSSSPPNWATWSSAI